MMSPHCLLEVEGVDKPLTREEWKPYRRAFLNAVPDVWIANKSLTTEGKRVMWEFRATGTHTGPGLGIPPSGRKVDFTGVSFCFFDDDGLIVRGVDRWNRGEVIASLMQVRMDELQNYAGLTQRESQVALLLAERFTHKEIAQQLGIQPNTARRHSERVLQKLGLSSRHDVAAALGKVPGSVLARHGSDMDTRTR
jgi:DNA-binding CsgD family transcriptional regulator/predicted ester cyclase